MPKRVLVTASQLRQGIGPLVTLLMQGHEVILTNQNSPVAVIRRWTQADDDGVADAGPRADRGKEWDAVSDYRTSHLKPTFSPPPD